MSTLELKNVSKSFGAVQAVKQVSFTLESHKVYGLLGRNGAGKSTILNMISGRLFADQGQILLDGKSIEERDSALGQMYLMSEKNLYPDGKKIKQIWKWTANFYPQFDQNMAESLAAKFGLSTSKKVKSLSTGYGSIFRLITALSSKASFIFLDEPVLGLDANHRELFYRIIVEYITDHPCCLLLSTHLIEEAAGLLEEVLIIKDGEIIKSESREKLLAQGYTVSGVANLVDRFLVGKNCLGIDSLGGLKTAYILGNLEETEVPSGLEIGKMDLQRLFIQLTNQ